MYWSKYALWSLLPLGLFAIYLIWNSQGALVNEQEVDSKINEFIKDRCHQSEQVNRHLLQHSWFYDQDFSNLAGAFGQTTFSLYEKDNPKKEIYGAFCIDGKNLNVTYYQRKFVPIKANFSEIKFGLKLKKLNDDVLIIKELNSKRMILVSKNNNIKHVFYRKN